MSTIVISNRVHPEVLAELGACADICANQTAEPLSREALAARCKDAVALMAFMPDAVDEAFLAACPKLSLISCALKGYDNFDLAACERHGVVVTIVEDLLTAPTAELAVGQMIGLARNLLVGDRQVRKGAFSGWRAALYGASIGGSTVGLFGFGAVGQAIAARLGGFECRLLCHDLAPPAPELGSRLRVEAVDLETIRRHSDFVVLGLPLTPATYHLVDASFLADMKPGALLVNPARGSLVDEAAVAEALERGQLGGYAADVFEMEDWRQPGRPHTVDARLRASPRTLLTPHLGSAVASVRLQIELQAARNIVTHLNGERPAGAITSGRQAPC